MNAPARLPVLVAAYPSFAEFQVTPALYVLRDHIEVTVAGPDRSPLRSECGLRVLPDAAWQELDAPAFALAIVPGAPDMRFACESAGLLDLLRRCAAGGAVIGALSGGPLVLHYAGLLAGRDYTTSIRPRDRATIGLDPARYRESDVVGDGPVVTAKGHAALAFAVAVTRLLGIEVPQGRVDYLRGVHP
jgi:4-methyl-5(b-hydroxyethyl)-thiazole monophosphate biosynthesis